LRRLFFGRGQLEYTVNLYKGCTHGCVYCYAPSLVHDEREWGTFVDAKVNAPSVLRAELRDAPKAPVFLSSASDPYQPVEARYGLTRRCLEELQESGFPVVILTRSPLVLRDVGLLKRFEWARVGCSISTAAGRFFEPGVPPLERRLETLKALGRQGIRTWVSLAPVVPGVSNVDVDALLSKLREVRVQAVTPGLLRFQGYERSRKMFEALTGMESDAVLRDGQAVIEQVRDAISRAGFQEAGEFFRWEASHESGGLDGFLEGRRQEESAS
jgi:DNA repair photolyase